MADSSVNQVAEQHVHVSSELKRRAYAFKAVLASTVGYAMDGFDLLVLGFILNAVAGDLGLTTSEAGALVTWTLIGAVAGGLLFGALSDYYGRVKVLTWSIVLFAIATGLCALAQGYWDILIYRTVAGIGLGGEFGIGMALAAESCRPSERARMSSYVGLGWQAGVLAAALLTPLLLPYIGWRGMFAIGALPALASFVIRLFVREPEIFTEKRKTPRAGNPFKALIANQETFKASIGISVLTSVQNFGYYGIMVWMPSYLSSQFHYSLTKSAMWTAVTVVGMATGICLFGHLADRFGRRPVFLTYQVLAALMVVVYSQLTDPMMLLIGGAIMGMFVNGMMGGYGALISEIYPTEARATAQNVLFNIGRGIGSFGPVAVSLVVSLYSFPVAIAMLALLYVLDILATLFLIPEKAGQTLE